MKKKKEDRNIVRVGTALFSKSAEALLEVCRIPISILRNFEILNVDPNGNCCYLAAQQFLYETDRQTALSITDFRKLVQSHLVELKETLRNKDTNTCYHRMGGEEMFQELVDKAYVAGKDFTAGCSEALWGNMSDLAPMFILKYNIVVVVYSPHMNSKYWYDATTGKIEQVHGDSVPSPSITTMKNTMSVIFKGSHYYLIRPRKFKDKEEQLDAAKNGDSAEEDAHCD